MTSFISHLFLIIQFELKRLFASRKGLLYLITLVAVWLLILLYPVRLSANFFTQTDQGQSNVILAMLGLKSFISWPIVEFQVHWRLLIIFMPLLSIIIASDQTSSDRKRGTLRFLALRTTRERLFFGRFFAIVFIQFLIIIFTLACTLVLVVYRDSSLFLVGLQTALFLFINLSIVLLPFSALMAALSATLSSSRQSIMWAVLFIFVLSAIIRYLSISFPMLDSLQLFIPSVFSSEISNLSGLIPLKLAVVPLFQTLTFLVIGRWIMMSKKL